MSENTDGNVSNRQKRIATRLQIANIFRDTQSNDMERNDDSVGSAEGTTQGRRRRRTVFVDGDIESESASASHDDDNDEDYCPDGSGNDQGHREEDDDDLERSVFGAMQHGQSPLRKGGARRGRGRRRKSDSLASEAQRLSIDPSWEIITVDGQHDRELLQLNFSRGTLRIKSREQLCHFLSTVGRRERRIVGRSVYWGHVFNRTSFMVFQTTARCFYIVLNNDFLTSINETEQINVVEFDTLLLSVNRQSWGPCSDRLGPMFDYMLDRIHSSPMNGTGNRFADIARRFFVNEAEFQGVMDRFGSVSRTLRRMDDESNSVTGSVGSKRSASSGVNSASKRSNANRELQLRMMGPRMQDNGYCNTLSAAAVLQMSFRRDGPSASQLQEHVRMSNRAEIVANSSAAATATADTAVTAATATADSATAATAATAIDSAAPNQDGSVLAPPREDGSAPLENRSAIQDEEVEGGAGAEFDAPNDGSGNDGHFESENDCGVEVTRENDENYLGIIRGGVMRRGATNLRLGSRNYMNLRDGFLHGESARNLPRSGRRGGPGRGAQRWNPSPHERMSGEFEGGARMGRQEDSRDDISENEDESEIEDVSDGIEGDLASDSADETTRIEDYGGLIEKIADNTSKVIRSLLKKSVGRLPAKLDHGARSLGEDIEYLEEKYNRLKNLSKRYRAKTVLNFQKLQNAQQDRAKAEAELQAIVTRRTRITAQCAEMEEKLGVGKRIEDLISRESSLEKNLEKLTGDSREAESILSSLREDRDKCISEHNETMGKLERARKDLEATSSRLGSLESEERSAREAMRSRIAEIEAEEKVKQASIDALKASECEYKRKLVGYEEKLAEFNSLDGKCKELENKHGRYIRISEQYKADALSAEREYNEKKIQLDSLSARIKDLEDSHKAKKDQCVKEMNKLREDHSQKMREESRKVESERAALENDKQVLRRDRQALEEEKAGLKEREASVSAKETENNETAEELRNTLNALRLLEVEMKNREASDLERRTLQDAEYEKKLAEQDAEYKAKNQRLLDRESWIDSREQEFKNAVRQETTNMFALFQNLVSRHSRVTGIEELVARVGVPAPPVALTLGEYEEHQSTGMAVTQLSRGIVGLISDRAQQDGDGSDGSAWGARGAAAEMARVDGGEGAAELEAAGGAELQDHDAGWPAGDPGEDPLFSTGLGGM